MPTRRRRSVGGPLQPRSREPRGAGLRNALSPPSWTPSNARKRRTGGGTTDAGAVVPQTPCATRCSSGRARNGSAPPHGWRCRAQSATCDGQSRGALCRPCPRPCRCRCPCRWQAGRERPPPGCPLLRPGPDPDGVAHAPLACLARPAAASFVVAMRRAQRRVSLKMRRELVSQSGFAGSVRS